jgi:tetratricopeptide (TPR) repeat protein/transcriptional regulator with XRE-family HTH domain
VALKAAQSACTSTTVKAYATREAGDEVDYKTAAPPFGSLLRLHRRRLGFTQEALGERAGFSVDHVKKLEGGSRCPSASAIDVLALALQLEAGDLECFREAGIAARLSDSGSTRARTNLPVQVTSFKPPRADQVAFGAVAREHDSTLIAPIGVFLGAHPIGPLIGREHELHRILGAAERAVDGVGGLVLVSGEPGVGKTRLAQEVTTHLREREFLVAIGRCYEPQQAVPYYAFLDALATAHALAPPPIRAGAGRRWPYLGYLLPDELGVRPVASDPSPDDQARLCRAVTGFLLALAESRPVAILLDDLHWMDSAGLDLLHHLAREGRTHRLLLLGTFRDREASPNGPLERVLVDLSREGLAEEMTVGCICWEETARLTAATLGDCAIGEGLTQLLHARTDGNPFYIHQVLQTLTEQDEGRSHLGAWSANAVEELGVPETVRAVIRRRLSRLSHDNQRILQEASVLEQTFSFNDLCAMSSSPKHDVEDALDAAIEAGMVREVDRNGYMFDHALTRDTLYAQLTRLRLRRLHLVTGEAIQALSEGKRKGRAAELAWHFTTGDDPHGALRWTMAAGDEAELVFAHDEAAIRYEQALKLAADLGDRSAQLDAAWKLGRARWLTGCYEEALKALQQSATTCRRAGDDDMEALVVAQMMQIHWRRGEYTLAHSLSEPVEERLREAAPSVAGVQFYSALSFLRRFLMQNDAQVAAAERAVEMARSMGDDLLLARALHFLGAALSDSGRSRQARQALREAIPILEQHHDLVDLLHAHLHMGMACRHTAELEATLHH